MVEPTPADPTSSTVNDSDLIIKEQTENMNDYADAINKVNTAKSSDVAGPFIAQLMKERDAIDAAIISSHGHALSMTNIKATYNDILQPVSGASLSIGDFTKKIDLSSKSLGLLGAALLTATQDFEGLSGVNYSNLNSYGQQIDKLSAALKGGGAAHKAAESSVKLLGDMLQSVMPGAAGLSKAIETGGEVLLGFAKNVLEAADNSLRLQTAMISVAGATGSIDELYRKAGPNLENMNSLIAEQKGIIDKTADATNTDRKIMEQYWVTLGKIPGASQEIINNLGALGSKTNNLTAITNIAKATGQDEGEMLRDKARAYKELGIVGDDYLQFNVRFLELSKKLGVPLEDVHEALFNQVDVFSKFTNSGEKSAKMTEGLTAIMKDYASALEATGMSSTRALAASGQIVNAFGNMSVAQKSFLSSQTGGPGGILGAVQIEKLLREGKVVEVQKKVQEALKKQLGGSIVTQADVKDEASAEIYQKQKMMLMSGPLGSQVKTDDDAAQMLEAMKNGTLGKALSQKDMGLTGKSDEGGVNFYYKKGVEIAQTSGGTLHEMEALLNKISSNTDITSKALVAKLGGALPGDRDRLTPDQMQVQKNTRAHQEQAIKEAGKETSISGNDKLSLSRNVVPLLAEQLKKDGKELFEHATVAMSAAFSAVKRLLSETKDIGEVESGGQEFLNALKQKKDELAKSNLSSKEKYAQLSDLNRYQKQTEAAMQSATQRIEKSPGFVRNAPQMPQGSNTSNKPGFTKGTISNAPGIPAMPNLSVSATSIPKMPGSANIPSAPGMLKGTTTSDQFISEAEKMMAAIKKKFGDIIDVNDATKSDDNSKKYEQERKMLAESTFGKKAGKDFDIDKMLSSMKQAQTSQTRLGASGESSALRQSAASQAPGAPGAVPTEVTTPPVAPKPKTFKLPGDPSLDPDDPNFGSSTATTAGSKLAEAPRAPVAASTPSTAPTRRPGEVATTTSQPAPAPTVHVTKEGPSGAKIYVTVKVEDSPQSHSIAPVPTP